MNIKLKILFFLLTFVYVRADIFQSTLNQLKTNTNVEDQKNAVLALIRRAIPGRAAEFDVEINPDLDSNGKDVFLLKKVKNLVKILGTDGVTAATGFNYYLKYYCLCQIDWQISQLNLPEELPEVDIKIILNDRVRYYQNVCTTSYSFVWWNWKQWEKHIDWMAMNSFNLVLAFNGQEAIWQRVYQKFNLTQNEIDEQFTGPAFLSWLRMGNIRGWAGPLPDNWQKRSLLLQKQILKRMREFGIIPVLPAFPDHLPRAFKRLYPDANMMKIETWNSFNDTYCCPYFLDPTESLFKAIGKMFIEEQIVEYGTDNVYSCDSFNEISPPSTDLQYLSNVSRSIYEAITEADPNGVWLMQGWLFAHDMFFWTKERAKALLTGVPLGKMIVLDLQSEQFPQYDRLEQYFGQPYIWCMLHNFGGTLGNFGSINILNQAPLKARNAVNSTMIGIGLTPEGINQNYVVYDFMIENVWRNESEDVNDWTRKYITRRYGNINDELELSWQQFMGTIYNFEGIERIRGQYALSRTPSWKINTWTWYDRFAYQQSYTTFVLGMEIFDNLENCTGCLYDLTDFSRQVLQIQCDLIYEKMLTAFTDKNITEFKKQSDAFLERLYELDDILATSSYFLLGSWIEDAKNCANNSDEAKFYEYNARNQITLWGPNGEIMNYANKQWSGVVIDFFLPRWQLFINYTKEILSNNRKFNQSYIKEQMFTKVEKPFTFSNKLYPIKPKGNLMSVVRKLVTRTEKDLKNYPHRSERSFRINANEDDNIDYLSLYGKPKVVLVKK